MRSLVLLVLLLHAGPTLAETRVYFGFGVNGGGDSLAIVQYRDGSAEALRAGDGYGWNLGVVHAFEDTPFSLQATGGYLIDETSAYNSRARFSRYPLEALGFWQRGNHRLGGGLTWHLSPTLNLDNIGGRLDFDDALGAIVEYGYGAFSFRYTFIDYSVPGFADRIDGDGFGIYVSVGY